MNGSEHWGVVLCGGGAPRKEEFPAKVRDILRRRPYLCAADGGYLHALSLGLPVDFLLGDMDSLDDAGIDYRRLGVPHQRYPKEKEYTDTQLAMQHLRQRGCQKILQIGGGSGRIDQLLHHYHLQFSADGADIWLSDLGCAYRVHDSLQLHQAIGQYLGIFSLGPSQFSSEGLPAYLKSVQWPDHRACSVCTRVTQPSARIIVHQGHILVTVSLTSPKNRARPARQVRS